MEQSELTDCDRSALFHQKSENPENNKIPLNRSKLGIYSGIEAVIWDLLLKTVGAKFGKWMRPGLRV